MYVWCSVCNSLSRHLSVQSFSLRMASGPPYKKRKTTSPNSRTQPTVTDFFKPTRKDSRGSEEVIVVDSSSESSTITNDSAAPISNRDRESSPELFSSPAYVDVIATALSRDHPVSDQELVNSFLLPVAVNSSPESTRTRSTTSRSDTPCSSISPDADDISPWSGAPLNELCFGPSAYPILPALIPSSTHSVLFRPRLKAGSLPQPFPDKFKDVWDQHHVRMPCSSKSMYPLDSKGLVPRWDLIKKALGKTIANSYDFEEALLSYNSHYSKKWSFRGLHSYFGETCSEEESSTFFSVLLPKIIDLALSLPNVVTHAVPLLKKQQDYSVTFSQHQIACLIANAFLCTFPRRNTRQRSSEYSTYPSINFNSMFSNNAGRTISQDRVNKLRCLFHYFTRVTKKMPQGTVTFRRQVLNAPPEWDKSSSTFTKLHVCAEGTIEDQGHGMLQVDFANKYLGGGVLSGGCVQEEIRFLICPELILSRLFTEELDSNESLVMTGAERFSNYVGYSSSFEWSGSHRDETTRDRWGRIQTEIVAIDALVFYSQAAQFKPGTIRRELNKAYCGFMSNDYPSSCGRSMAVATGNWGCGAFGGDSRLKGLLQLMAAAVADRDLVYFTFGDRKLQQELASVHCALVKNDVTVGQVWSALVNYQSYRTRPDKPSLYSYLHTALKLPQQLPQPSSPGASRQLERTSRETSSEVDTVVVSSPASDDNTTEYSLH